MYYNLVFRFLKILLFIFFFTVSTEFFLNPLIIITTFYNHPVSKIIHAFDHPSLDHSLPFMFHVKGGLKVKVISLSMQ